MSATKTTEARLAALSPEARAELRMSIVEHYEAELAKYADRKADDQVAIPCWKCNGQGYGPWPLDEGRCWGCNATGTHYRSVRNIRAGIRRNITEEFKSAERVVKVREERTAKAAAFAAVAPELVEALATREGFDFLGSLADQLRSKGELTERQVEAARKALAIEAERQAAEETAEPVPTGRVQVTGLVVSLKTQDTRYGTTYKMLVLDDRGFKVFGTEPSSLSPAKGDRVTFMAALEPSGDDPKFGFFSRPTKAAILEEAAE